MDLYEFTKQEEPLFPGTPYIVRHPPGRRAAYAAIGLWICATATLANATITVNLANLSGEVHADVAELSWLPASYVAANACANLLLVRIRALVGLEKLMRPLLVLYALLAGLQFIVAGFTLELVVRAVSGLAAAGLITLGIYYMMQTAQSKISPVPLIVGLGVSQLGTPLARLLPVDMLALAQWRGQHGVEIAIVLTTLALMIRFPLPPTKRANAFEPVDLVTVALVVPAMFLVCGVVNRGRAAWWTDTPWLGQMLAVAIPLLAAGAILEACRRRPLIAVDWISTFDVLRFVAVAFLMRLALAEQTYGAVGLLTSGGVDDDQLHQLFGWVIAGMVFGTTVCALTITPAHIPWQVIVAALAIALGAWFDSRTNTLTRPEQLYASQALIGFGTSLFVGPTLAKGLLKAVAQGWQYFVSVVVLFGITQNFGGLLGSAVLGSYQTISARHHAADLAQRLQVGDPLASAQLQAGAAALRGVVTDPALQAQASGRALADLLAREANALAYSDVFRVVFYLAIGTALYVAWLQVLAALRAAPRRATP